MAAMFSKPKMPDMPDPPPPPKPVRMPAETDPQVQAAMERTRQNAMRRSSRLSTIMTDQTRSTTGSSGQKLGA